MANTTSIAQEYYKIQDAWREVMDEPTWRLAIWSVQFEDLDIVDKFLEIERSTLGISDDIFFRFDTPFQEDYELFEKELWTEYISWFDEELPEKYDVLKALKDDNLLLCDYYPDTKLTPNAENLWLELKRLKDCIKGYENINFCIYMPPTPPSAAPLTRWFRTVIEELPQGVRMVTIDYAKQRKVKLGETNKVVILSPKLDMPNAIKNEMDKESGSFDATKPESLYRKQVREVMECTVKKDEKLLTKEINRLFSYSQEMGKDEILFSTPLIAAQAYYSIQNFERSLYYAEEAVRMSREKMIPGDATAYSIWKVAAFLKAGLLSARKKREKGIEMYEEVAEKATEMQDIFYIMEAYRMSGFLYYELDKKQSALERFLLSLEAGSYLDLEVRRTSTFVISANFAIKICRELHGSSDTLIIEQALEKWIGNDWRDVLGAENLKKSTARRKSSWLS